MDAPSFLEIKNAHLRTIVQVLKAQSAQEPVLQQGNSASYATRELDSKQKKQQLRFSVLVFSSFFTLSMCPARLESQLDKDRSETSWDSPGQYQQLRLYFDEDFSARASRQFVFDVIRGTGPPSPTIQM